MTHSLDWARFKAGCIFNTFRNSINTRLPQALIDYQISAEKACLLTFSQAKLMVIDFEMTGLDPLQDQIVSMGLVPIEHGQILLNKAMHQTIAITGSVGDSATVHGIVDNELDNAIPLKDAINWFLEQTQGYVLVAHHVSLDVAFLQSAINHCWQEINNQFRLPAIDTLEIERRRYLYQHGQLVEGCLRLGQSRERYHLPVYPSHHALTDAIACAELLLAQVNKMGELDEINIYELAHFY